MKIFSVWNLIITWICAYLTTGLRQHLQRRFVRNSILLKQGESSVKQQNNGVGVGIGGGGGGVEGGEGGGGGVSEVRWRLILCLVSR